MKCPNCGNELSPGEVFCGQCGAPNVPPAKPTEMVQAPPQRSGLLSGGYNTQLPSLPSPYNTAMQPPPNPTGQLSPGQSVVRPPGPRQQDGFYHEATEAISALPNSGQNYPIGYPQQGFIGTPTAYPTAGQYTPQVPFQTGSYAGPAFPPSQPFPSAQGYGMPPGLTPPPPKHRSNVVLFIAIICLVFAIIAVGAFGALYLIHNNQPAKTPTNTAATPTTAITVTTIPSPSPTVTDTPSPTPTPSPSPTVIPADPGFILCDTTCTSIGFSVEYPMGWQQSQTSDSPGTQFTNPLQQETFAAFKAPGTASTTADNLVTNDLNNNFASKHYIIRSSFANATIAGETWVYEIASYQANDKAVRLEVFATVHQSKAYIIELQAPDDQNQFDTVNSQYFQRMLNRFQFQ